MRPHGLAVVVCLLVALASATGAQAAVYPTDFEEVTMAGGLSQPTAVAWTPDGRMLVTEKAGRLKVVPAGATTAATVLDITGKVNSRHDRGLLGLAVDSSFATNRYVYLLYSYDVTPLTPDSDGRMVSRLTRLELRADNTVGPEVTLVGSYSSGPCPTAANTVDCIPSDGLSHSIGTVRSAPDGTLWMGSGDAASFSNVDPLAYRTYDERSLAGKILHLDRNGNGLSGHPFCPGDTDLTKVCAKVHAKGFRNPFRFKLRPGGGLTVGDVGWGTREEVDLVRAGGGNYGWPCYEGTIHQSGYGGSSQCAAEYAKEGTADAVVLPQHDYGHGGNGNSVLGGPTYTGDQYPAGYRDTIFFGDYAEGFIRRLEVNGDNVTAVRAFATDWSGVDLETAPNGDLAYVSFGTGADGTGSIERIAYAPGNRRPLARATGTPSSGDAPLDVRLDATGSSDPDGDPLTYRWNFGDGTAEATGATPPVHRYANAGAYTATVTVSDGRGGTASATVAINAGEDAPTATIAAPADGAEFTAGDAVSLSGSGTDRQDGTLPGTALSWRVVLHHGGHTHPMLEVAGQAQASFDTRRDHDADSFYEVTLTARDSSGLTGTRTITLRPRTVPLRLESTPAGVPVSYAGVERATPFAADAAIGFTTSISAPETFTGTDGHTYAFERWSDGGARLHDVTIPASATTYTAVYRDTGGPAGPVAAYGFDAGSGATLADTSGRGNTGTISGATWTTAGKYGGALTFDGTNDWVTVPDANSLDLTDKLTMEAWVRPTAITGYRTVFMKEMPGTFAYALYAGSSGTSRPSGWANDTGDFGPTTLPTNTWTHLAATYDGTTYRLYTNGTQVRTKTAPDRAPNTTAPLRIGGTAIWNNEWFAGQIDEIRIYDRALTATEITRDRDTRVGP